MLLFCFAIACAIVIGTLLTGWQLTYALAFVGALLAAAFIFRTRYHSHRFIGGLLFSVILAMFYGHLWLGWQLESRLSSDQDKSPANLQLYVVNTDEREGYVRILATVLNSKAELQSQNLPPLRHVQLNIYPPLNAIPLGSTFTAAVQLRAPRNFSNGLAFDYEAHLLMQQIDAMGYVRRLITVPEASTLPLRTRLLNYEQAKYQSAAWRWIAGLVFGEQAAFSAAEWRLAKQTGTLHLLVVSGMRVGFVVLVLAFIWTLGARIFSVIAKRNVPLFVWNRALFLLLGSGLYVWIAGSGVALVRAWIMLAIVLLLHGSRLRLNWLQAFACALVVVLLVNPLVWTSAGFMYSFAAVFVLLLFFQGRTQSIWELLWLSQAVIFLGLLPLFLWWSQPVSGVQFLANLIAIPLVNLVLLPCALLSIVLPLEALINALVWVGEGFWQILDIINNIPLPKIPNLSGQGVLLWFGWLLFLSRGISWLYAFLGISIVLMAIFMFPKPPLSEVVLVDVGQGQGMIFSSPSAVIVYDAGPKFSAHFDAGEALMRPMLESLGVHSIARLVISHPDLDHAGGAEALLHAFDVQKWIDSEGLAVDNKLGPDWQQGESSHAGKYENLADLPRAENCHAAGHEWVELSDFVLYRFLNISSYHRLNVKNSSNNRSCVMQIDWYGTRFLLTGDIGLDAELALIREYGQALSSDILLLAHHGSKHSSSLAWLQQVAPKEVWISAGFNNRFQHPSHDTLARLSLLHIPWRNTAQDGAIKMNAQGQIWTQRRGWQPPWRQP